MKLLKQPMQTLSKLLLGGLVVSVALVGCDSTDTTNKMSSEAIEAAINLANDSDADVKIDIDGDNQDEQNVVIKSGDDEFTIAVGGNVMLPEGFPDDVPLPENMQYISAAEVIGTGFSVQGSVPGNLQAMISQTQADAKKSGWEEAFTVDQGSMKMISMTKGERMVSYSIGELPAEDIEIEGHNIMYMIMTVEDANS